MDYKKTDLPIFVLGILTWILVGAFISYKKFGTPLLAFENLWLAFLVCIVIVCAVHAKNNKKLTQFKLLAVFLMAWSYVFQYAMHNHILSIHTLICAIAMCFGMRYKPKKEGVPNTFEDAVKQQLDLNFVTNKKVRFPKGLRWVGGLTMPMLPMFTVQNSSWKERSQEVVIHENMHLHLFLRYWLFILLIAAFTLPSLVRNLNPYAASALLAVMLSAVLTIHEWDCFTKTHSFAKKQFGIETARFSMKYGLKYLLIYSAQILIIIYVISGILTLIQLLS